MMSLLFDHLWQSTLFAAFIGLLTLAFRRNGAAVRYGLWFAASLKFLLPFSLLLALGGALAPAAVPAPVFHRIAEVAQSLPDAHLTSVIPATSEQHLTPLLLVLWACGFAGLTAVWLIRWARLNGIVRDARRVATASPLPVKATTALIEPGLAGVWRPVLLLPEDILKRLSPRELAAIEAHERCHLARHDNLTAAIHMLVTNLFWFHPLLWWLGARLIEERNALAMRPCSPQATSPRPMPAVS